jgi:hypothetical protein
LWSNTDQLLAILTEALGPPQTLAKLSVDTTIFTRDETEIGVDTVLRPHHVAQPECSAMRHVANPTPADPGYTDLLIELDTPSDERSNSWTRSPGFMIGTPPPIPSSWTPSGLQIVAVILLILCLAWQPGIAAWKLYFRASNAHPQLDLLDKSLPLFAILGRTGVGKSSFIHTLRGRYVKTGEAPIIGHSLGSCKSSAA